MNDWSVYYKVMGKDYVLPIDRCITVETGQGWHSGPWNRGLMSVLAHFVGRLIMGRKYAPDGGRVRYNVFHITAIGMMILKKCQAFANGQNRVSFGGNSKIVPTRPLLKCVILIIEKAINISFVILILVFIILF